MSTEKTTSPYHDEEGWVNMFPVMPSRGSFHSLPSSVLKGRAALRKERDSLLLELLTQMGFNVDVVKAEVSFFTIKIDGHVMSLNGFHDSMINYLRCYYYREKKVGNM